MSSVESPRSRCVLTSSQQTWRDANPVKDSRATRLLAFETQTTVRVSSPAPKKPARKDSAACVSLSSYHNVKEPFEPEGDASSPNPRWKQNPHRESTTAATSRDELRS